MPPRKAKAAAKPRYRALVGLHYPDPQPGAPAKRVEAGEIVDDLPSLSVDWLLAQGRIEKVK